MLCDICHKKEATVHLTEIVNDKISKMHLCEDCAREKGEEMESHFGLSDLLAGLADFGGQKEVSGAKNATCSGCGFSLSEFQRIGRLGCPKCYESFSEQLIPLLRRIHGSDKHMGKLPIRSTGTSKISRDAKELNDLKIKLQKAIEQEAFEAAAELRDKIRSLETKFKKDIEKE